MGKSQLLSTAYKMSIFSTTFCPEAFLGLKKKSIDYQLMQTETYNCEDDEIHKTPPGFCVHHIVHYVRPAFQRDRLKRKRHRKNKGKNVVKKQQSEM